MLGWAADERAAERAGATRHPVAGLLRAGRQLRHGEGALRGLGRGRGDPPAARRPRPPRTPWCSPTACPAGSSSTTSRASRRCTSPSCSPLESRVNPRHRRLVIPVALAALLLHRRRRRGDANDEPSRCSGCWPGCAATSSTPTPWSRPSRPGGRRASSRRGARSSCGTSTSRPGATCRSRRTTTTQAHTANHAGRRAPAPRRRRRRCSTSRSATGTSRPRRRATRCG